MEVTGNDPAFEACKAPAYPSRLYPQKQKARQDFHLNGLPTYLLFLRAYAADRKSPLRHTVLPVALTFIAFPVTFSILLSLYNKHWLASNILNKFRKNIQTSLV